MGILIKSYRVYFDYWSLFTSDNDPFFLFYNRILFSYDERNDAVPPL